MATFKTFRILKRNIIKFHAIRLKSSIKIVEVGPRDGLQNEPISVPTSIKIDFIDQLSKTGLKTIEVTSFVSPKWVPQMADNVQVYSGINKNKNISYPVLVPNLKGLDSALQVGAKEISVFLSASEGFSKKNINCSVNESLKNIKFVIDKALEKKLKIRGYISCIVGCPYDGNVNPAAVTKIAEELLSYGCYEISLGDTIGVGTKIKMEKLLENLLSSIPANKLAIHCHDTYGQALVNICTSLDRGITVIDSAVGGLGGCPYAKGATGNISTEDLIFMLEGMGIETGIDLHKLIKVGRFISDFLKRPPASKVNNALYSSKML